MSSVGAAHHALRAYVWACNQRANDGARYRYRLDGETASVVDQNQEVLAEAPLSLWAAQGRTIRAALIGLKYMCDRVEHALALDHKFQPARLAMDALNQTALISIAGGVLSRDECLSRAKDMWLSEGAVRTIQSMKHEEFATIDGWARLGRQLELDYFFALQGAETYGLEPYATAERERGFRLGILSRPRFGSESTSEQESSLTGETA